MTKTVKILRGLPGSGKTTYAEHLAGALIVSADHFFAVEGVYRFDSRVLPFAHSHCWIAFKRAVIAGVPLVVLDNTNVKVEHFGEYVGLARSLCYEVEIHEFRATAAEAHERNVHAVPFGACKRMAKQWEVVPEHWRDFVRPGKTEAA